MKTPKKIFALILLVLSSLVLVSCSLTPTKSNSDNTNTTTVEVNNGPIRLIDEVIELNEGENKRIRYEKLTSKTLDITFLTNDPSVATVNKMGYVIAKGPGETTVEINVDSFTYTVTVKVTQGDEFTPPLKLVYTVGDPIDLTGCTIKKHNPDGSVKEIIQVTESMISGFDSTEAGTKTVTVKYQTDTFEFGISVVKAGGADIYDFKVPAFSEVVAGKSNQIRLEAMHLDELKSSLTSLYDYDEFEISFDITTPSNTIDTIYAFYTQDYDESHKSLSQMNSNKNLEGQVISKTGFNYQTNFTKNGYGYYAVRYNPKETGTYTFKMNINVSGENIITKEGSFKVNSKVNSKGVIHTSSNKMSFVFEDGTTYVPVGANIAWYNSSERRYNDYTMFLEGMVDGGFNFMRYWAAAWGTCLWWENITDYTNRLDEAYEQDLILEMMGENGIYVDLSFYAHGMFSSNVNPMWKGSSNTWYTQKYGYNPYSDVLNNGGEFFSDEFAKKWTKNYLKYEIARYTSYDSVLSYELFNEIDWIETYNINNGKNWHTEMASFIKSIDYKDRMITTSIKSDKNSSVAQSLYTLPLIDYVNYHVYGTYNFITYFQQNSKSYVEAFNKPVMIQECDYSGNSGTDQHNIDPENTSLHAQIWAGMLGVGSSAMSWWWDTLLEKYNVYNVFKGASVYAKEMNLEGSFTYIQSNSKVTLSGTSASAMGFDFGTRKYIYVYNRNFKVGSTNLSSTNTINITTDNGTYKVRVFNTKTGDIITNETKTVSLGKLTLSLSYTDDVALIIEKN